MPMVSSKEGVGEVVQEMVLKKREDIHVGTHFDSWTVVAAVSQWSAVVMVSQWLVASQWSWKSQWMVVAVVRKGELWPSVWGKLSGALEWHEIPNNSPSLMESSLELSQHVHSDPTMCAHSHCLWYNPCCVASPLTLPFPLSPPCRESRDL
jgi:hypothetical protein